MFSTYYIKAKEPIIIGATKLEAYALVIVKERV